MPPSQLVIRNCQTVPENLEGHSVPPSPKLIMVKHPGYPAQVNDFITLRAYDSLDGCIHHETARIACGILCGNRWDGYFTETSDGPPLVISCAGLLPAGVYYFQLPRPLGTDQSWVYPVVPCFAHWTFPHDNLPGLWAPQLSSLSPNCESRDVPIRSDANVAALERDGSCRISSRFECCNVAHIIPRNELQWFDMNSMYKYAAKESGNYINDVNNVFLLRQDLHFAFDQRKFAIVPKTTDIGQDSPKWVVHLLVNSHELSLLYHNVQLQPTTVSSEFLFARFAWSLFPRLAGVFLDRLLKRKLIIVRSTNLEREELECLPRDYDFSTFPPQINSQPPKKKSKSSTNKEAADLSKESSSSPVYTLSNQSTPPPVKSEPHSAFPLNKEELDDCRLKSLKERYLEAERARSDPEGHWHKDQRWLESVYGRPLSPDDIQRYLEITGLEFLDARK